MVYRKVRAIQNKHRVLIASADCNHFVLGRRPEQASISKWDKLVSGFGFYFKGLAPHNALDIQSDIAFGNMDVGKTALSVDTDLAYCLARGVRLAKQPKLMQRLA